MSEEVKGITPLARRRGPFFSPRAVLKVTQCGKFAARQRLREYGCAASEKRSAAARHALKEKCFKPRAVHASQAVIRWR